MRSMTTDRTAAPQRSTALLERPSTGSRSNAAPSDSFSSLLGAASPRPEEQQQSRPARRDDRQPSRADRPRDNAQRADRRDDQRRPDAAPRSDDDAKPAAADAAQPAAQDATAAPADAKPQAQPFSANLALQLAGPLPPTAAVTPAPVDPAQAQAQPATPAVPAFAPTALSTAAVAAGQNVAAAQTPADATAAPADPTQAPTVPTLPVVGPAPDKQTGGQTAQQQPGQQAPSDGQQPQTTAPAAAAPATDPTAAQQVTLPQAAATAQPAQDQAGTPIKVDAANASAAAAPTTTNVPVTPPIAAPVGQTTAAAALERAVPMRHVVETTGLLMHVAAEKGVTHARLNLKPVELGGIEVRLQHSPEGISAQLVADSPEAAKMLSQAADDLKRSLESRDVNLLSLDVSTSSDQQQFGQAQGGSFQDQFGENSSTNLNRGLNRDGTPADAVVVDAPAESTLALPNGVLVDVLA